MLAMSSNTADSLRARFPDLELTKMTEAAEHPVFHFSGFEPGQTTIPKGHMRSPGKKAFPVDVIFERDTAISMRDGIKIYTDIFRPVDSDTNKVPALIPWSPYGKTGTGPQKYLMMGPFHCGVPPERTSGYEKFEAPDPAEWCERGYAIINVDARGAGMSEGNISFWGIQEAEDIYDTIDWVSKQPWCSGSVAMVGNSWLAIAQINYASRLKHPALKALAPMEALNDPYRDSISRGGRPHDAGFNKFIINGFAGPNCVENMPAMLAKRPLFDDYWQSKYIQTENIDVPLYLLASYSSGLHVAGSFNTYRTAKTKQKWLRVHPYQEWHDLYREDVNNELQKYFDHFCKNVDNGWERDTPPVRLSLLGFDGSKAAAVIERPEKEWPLARQQLQKYYLDAANHTLVTEAPTTTSTASHEAHSLTASTDFKLHFNEQTEVAGYAKVRLWMSCAEKDDMDVVVQIRKIDASGKLLEHLNYPCPIPVDQVANVNVAKTLGPQGFLRASHSISRDESRSRQDGQEVFYAHDRREALEPGKVVPVEITLWPMGMVFAEGEGILLRVSGHNMNYPELEFVRLQEPEDENEGVHAIHTGGKYDSCLILPVIPKPE